MNFIKRCIAIFFLIYVGNVFAFQNGDGADLRFQTSITDTSLPNELIMKVAQDKVGFIWFGTRDGLIRYDGYKSTRYRHRIGDAESLNSNWVMALLSDSKGRFWIGTYEGLQEFNFRTERFENAIKFSEYPANPSLKKVTSIIEDNEGVIWVGTKGGLVKYSPELKQSSVVNDNRKSFAQISRTGVNTLAIDTHNNLWIGTAFGLTLKRNNSDIFEQVDISEPESKDGERKGALGVDSSYFSKTRKTLWIGTYRGLYALPLKDQEIVLSKEKIKRIEDVPKDVVLNITSDRLGNLWVGTLTNGLFLKRDISDRFINFRHQESDIHSLRNNLITSVFQDRTGILWVGSIFGVSKVDLSNSGFHHTALSTRKDRKQGAFITSITGNLKGKIYLATKEDGVIVWDKKGNTLKNFKHEPKEKFAQGRDLFLTVTIDKRDRVWVTTPYGIELLDEKTGKFVWHKESYSEPQMLDRSICDRNGNIWFASDRGLFRFDPESGKTIWIKPVKTGASSTEFEATNLVLEDKQGNILFLTERGIQVVDLATNTYQPSNGFFSKGSPNSPSRVNRLMQDMDGRIWAATDEGLLWAERNESGKGKSGFIPTENRISGLVQDREKKIWLSTSIGVGSFDLESLAFKYYTESVMRNSDGDMGGVPYVDENNIVYFAGFNGVTYFNPNEITENSTAPGIAILDVQVLNKARNNYGKDSAPQRYMQSDEVTPVTVPYSQSSISIEYTALHFANPRDNKYQYILENFDSDWIKVDSSKRYVQYSNLNPGSYRFRVKAASGNGIWSDEAVVEIVVAPPYWRTTQFWITITVFIIFIAVYVQSRIALRHKKIRNMLEAEIKERTLEIATQNKNKSKFIADAAHDLRQPIHAIGNLLEATKIAFEKKDQEKSLELLQLTKNATSLMRSSFNSILELSRIETGLIEPKFSVVDLSNLLLEIVNSFKALADEKGVKVEFHSNIEKTYIVRTDRILLGRVLSNLVSNAIKYSKTSGAKVIIRPTNIGRCCRLYILDNGIGMAESEIEKIFQPFYQINNPEHDRERGLGLGLSIVNATILALEDHSINLCSLPNKGTIFYVDLPLTTPSSSKVETQIEVRKSDFHKLSGLYVIYVEDDVLVRKSTEIVLREFGLLVASFRSAEELINGLAAIERKPDLILVDHNLPNSYTSEEIIEIVRDEFAENIPAIVISGQFLDASFPIQSSANLVMSKPVVPSELIRHIEEILEVETSLDTGVNQDEKNSDR